MGGNERKVLGLLIFVRAIWLQAHALFFKTKEINRLPPQWPKRRPIFNRPRGLCPKPWRQGHRKTWTGDIQQSYRDRTITIMGPQDRAWKQRLPEHWDLLEFVLQRFGLAWDLSPFLLSFSPFRYRNVYPMSVQSLYFGSTHIVCFHRLTAGEDFASGWMVPEVSSSPELYGL